ncbi:MAG: matrixin family metalloprotease [Acidobacteriota bacterium]
MPRKNARLRPLILVTALLALCGWNAAANPEATSTGPQLVPAVCFAPDTPEEAVRQTYTRHFQTQLLNSLTGQFQKFQFADGDRWTTTATDPGPLGQGDPTTLTWSIVPDGTSIFGYNGEPTSPSNLQAFLNSIYGSQAVWLPIIEGVFARWGDLNGVTYVFEPNDDGSPWTQFTIAPGVLGVRGDVRISGHFIDGPGFTLAYNFFPNFGDMVIDTGDTAYLNTANDSLVFRNVLAHEHGHGLGIRHVCPVNQTKLMEPFLSTNFDGPQFDDILAANRGYGDDFEDNDAPGIAADLGLVTPGTGGGAAISPSLDDNSDRDVYAITTSGGQQISVTATPLGTTYLSGPQLGSGACTPGTPFNPLDNQDLSIEVLDTNGSTVLGSVNATGAGSAESLSGVALPGAGTFFISIDGGTNNEAQLYDFSFSVDPVPGGYVHSVTPGTAGANNTFSVSGATPGQTTFFVFGLNPGSFNVPGCPGATVGMSDVNILSTSVADGAGNATFGPIFVGGGLSGVTVLFQAVELSTCTVSNLVVNTF